MLLCWLVAAQLSDLNDDELHECARRDLGVPGAQRDEVVVIQATQSATQAGEPFLERTLIETNPALAGRSGLV
jgi:hypothetical protein